MELSSGFVLQTEFGQQVGFILGSPGFSAASGDCVFMLLPTEPKLVDSALGVAMAEVIGSFGEVLGRAVPLPVKAR